MEYIDYLTELKKLCPTHKNVKYFERERGGIAFAMLKDAVEKQRRIKGIANLSKEIAETDTLTPLSQNDESLEPEFEDFQSAKVRILKANPTFRFEDLTPEMQAKYNQIGDLYKERTALHERAKISEISQEERAEAIKQAHEISGDIQKLYDEIDAYILSKKNASGEETETDTETNEVAQKLKKINLLRSQISKTKKKLETASEAERAEVQSKLDTLIKEKSELELWASTLEK